MKSDIFVGNYLFHIHTSFTDGKPSVREYFEHASRAGLNHIIFLEHIRCKPSYDVLTFVGQVKECAHVSGLRATVGFEAKVTADGVLDLLDEHLGLADVIGMAEHSFAGSFSQLHAALVKAMDEYSQMPDKTLVWVHPGLGFRKMGVLLEKGAEYLELIRYAAEKGLMVERNRRHGLIPDSLSSQVKAENLVSGADAHTLGDLALVR